MQTNESRRIRETQAFTRIYGKEPSTEELKQFTQFYRYAKRHRREYKDE